MRLRALRDACLGGFLYGSLLYGTVLSVIHVVHNHLASPRDALVVYAVFCLLYGLWAAAFFGLATLAASLFSHPRDQGRRGRLLGLLAFNLFFWEICFLYGLTYDQAPFHPDGAWGMAAVLIVLAVPIAAVTALASWLLHRVWGGLKWAAVAALLLGVAVHAAAPLYTQTGEKSAGTPPAIQAAATGLKVVLVGFDGADWRVIRPMMEKGELPAFAGLARDGASGDLATIHDSNSAVIWASIYTGEDPERHGVLDFYRIQLPGMASPGIFPVHRTYFKELSDLVAPLGLTRQIPVDRFSLAGAPLWEVADRAGMTVGVVDGYFYSFPALQVSRPGSWFFSYGLDEVAARPSGRIDLFMQPKATGLFRRIRPALGQGDFHWQSAVLLDLLGGGPQPRFVNFYTHEPDSAQHFYWKWYQPRRFFGVTERGLKEKAERIPSIHRDFDRFLAKLLAEVGPETVVIVASDHGHSPTIVHSLYTQHRHGPPGILLMHGGPVKRGLAVQGADIYDVYPTVLYLLGLPVPRDLAGKVLLDALDPGFVRLHPVRTVPSYRGLGMPANLPGASRDGSMNEMEIEKLRSLGYIF
ncbi:MAG TPA: alkaline phosphatase family protein [Thermoanaerobaculia bacterium]|nr:alkaline phosphatase family protein [Thermoanaerobaculia bacterium]